MPVSDRRNGNEPRDFTISELRIQQIVKRNRNRSDRSDEIQGRKTRKDILSVSEIERLSVRKSARVPNRKVTGSLASVQSAQPRAAADVACI